MVIIIFIDHLELVKDSNCCRGEYYDFGVMGLLMILYKSSGNYS